MLPAPSIRPPRRVPRPPTVQSVTLAAPIGGLNTIDAGASMPPTDCILLYNMVAAEYGLRTRLGYREWCTGLGDEVRTLLPFTGSAKNGSRDRLFAVTPAGIWDVTASSNAPTQVVGGGSGVAWNMVDPAAGTGSGCVFVNFQGAHFLLYCDEANGYYTYTESTTTWTRVTYAASPGAGQVGGLGPDGATPVDPGMFSYVTVWQNRVWFVQRDTGYAFYGGVGALYGALQPFTFGGRFKSGGDLRGLYNWTIDGGSGSINSLVAISGGGDVVIYQGTDPSSAASFGLKGVWSLGGGGVPAGRRIATDFGGDVLVLSTVGLIPLSRLVSGNPVFDRSQYATQKVANLFNQAASAGRMLPGWSVYLHPEDNTLLVNVPQPDGTMQQLAMSLATKGWSIYRDMPVMLSNGAWGGQLYFGTTDGRVCVNTDYLDGVTLATPGAYTPIQWEVLSAFQNLGSQRKKRVHHIRPTFISLGGAPPYTAQARFGYDFTELNSVPAVVTVPDGSATAFTLSRVIANTDQVFLDRVLNVWGTDYYLSSTSDPTTFTTSGNLITFVNPPATGAYINVYYLDGNSIPVSVPLGTAMGDTWDSGRWDQAHWAGSPTPTQPVTGGAGMGQDVAIIIRGTATSRTSLVGVDVFFDVGGAL